MRCGYAWPGLDRMLLNKDWVVQFRRYFQDRSNIHQQQDSHLKAQLQQLFSLKSYPEEMKEICKDPRVPPANCEWGMWWEISPQWIMHRQSWADNALPFFISLWFKQGCFRASSNKTEHQQTKKNPTRNTPLPPNKPTQKCLETSNKSWSTEMLSLKKNRGGRSPGKVFKIFRTF